MLVRLLRLPATLPDAAGTASDAAYAYDALGRIRTRTVGVSPSPVTTDAYSYAGASSEAARIATGGVNLDSVVTPSGDRVAALSGSVNWFLPDLHGSVSATLSSDQSTVTSATRYDAYGDAVATGTAGGTAVGATTWKYRGRLDVSPAALGTPLYAMGARLYDPGIGAFTSLDSYSGKAQDPLSMNRFLYAEANPATLVDPTGHQVCHAGSDLCDETTAIKYHATAAGKAALRRTRNRDLGLVDDPGSWKHLAAARMKRQWATNLAVARAMADAPADDAREGTTQSGMRLNVASYWSSVQQDDARESATQKALTSRVAAEAARPTTAQRIGHGVAGTILVLAGVGTVVLGGALIVLGVADLGAAGVEEVGSGGLATPIVIVQVSGAIALISMYGLATFGVAGTTFQNGANELGKAFGP